MRSPFRGMDPYLERYWPSVHHAVCVNAADQLNEVLPPDLVAEAGRVSIAGLPPARCTRVIEIGTERPVTAVEFVGPRDRVPVIAVPVGGNRPDHPLDLGRVVEHVYHHGRYDRRIDHRVDPVPPLDPDDDAWADGLLRAAGRR